MQRFLYLIILPSTFLVLSCVSPSTPTEPPVYGIGSDGNCAFLPLNINNKWFYNWHSHSYRIQSGQTTNDEYNEGLDWLGFGAQPTDSGPNNYWELRHYWSVGSSQYSSKILICHDSKIYCRDNDIPRLIISDEMDLGSETKEPLIGDPSTYVYQEHLDQKTVTAGTFQNVRHLIYTESGSWTAGREQQQPVINYYYTYNDQYFAEGIGLIYTYHHSWSTSSNIDYTDYYTSHRELTSYALH